MPTIDQPKKNHLLAALPEAEWSRWLPQLEPVSLPLGKVLYESGGVQSHVYFPTTAIVSLLYVMENGASAEIADRKSTRLNSSHSQISYAVFCLKKKKNEDAN